MSADGLSDDGGEEQAISVGMAGRILVRKLSDGLIEQTNGINDLLIGGMHRDWWE
jgi:hypothetical protein